jgi:hypothetical protein
MNLHDFSVFDMPLVTNDLLLNAQLPGFDFPDDITRDHLAKDYPVVYEFFEWSRRNRNSLPGSRPPKHWSVRRLERSSAGAARRLPPRTWS